MKKKMQNMLFFDEKKNAEYVITSKGGYQIKTNI